MSFEGASLERVDLEKIHRKATEAIESSRIREEDFIDVHGAETIEADTKEVRRLEAIFRRESSRESSEMKLVADVFEAIVLEHGELSDWFGPSATTLKTSKFDDYKNGIDMIVEFKGEEPGEAHFLGLATDVTFTSDTTNKFDRLKQQIDDGTLARAKYVNSEYADIHESLDKLPEVVIGASKKTVMELADMWLARENRALAKHKIQIMILRQMREQLEVFRDYARSIERDEAAMIYDERLKIVDRILKDKKDIGAEVRLELMNDPVHAEIMNFLKRWKAMMRKA